MCRVVQEALWPSESTDKGRHNHRIPGEVPPSQLPRDTDHDIKSEKPLPLAEGDQQWHQIF